MFYQKFESAFGNNKGFSIIKDVSPALNSGPMSLQEMNGEFDQISPLDTEKLKFAPLVSCDVRRVFSEYKTALANNKRSFLFENLKKYMIS